MHTLSICAIEDYVIFGHPVGNQLRVDLSWAKHEMQNQECSEFRELLVKKGLMQKDTLIHALIHVSSSSQLIGSSVTVISISRRSYYSEHPIELSNLVNVSECYERILFFFIHTEAMTEEFREVEYQK